MLTWLRALFAPLIAWLVNGSYVFQIQRAYLALGSGFTITDDPANNRTLIDVGGISTNPTFGTLTASEIDLGTGYTMAAGASGTMPGTGGSTVNIGSWTVPSGRVLRIEGRITIEAPVAGFGLLLLSASNYNVIANEGAGPAVVEYGSIGLVGNVPPFGGAAGVLGTSIVGNVVTATISPLTIPAWAGTTAYVGSLTTYGATNPPSAIMGTTGCSVVTNGGNVYVCRAGGTSAGSGGPTGTGSSITDGGATWCYVGPATAGIGFNWRVNLLVTIPGA